MTYTIYTTDRGSYIIPGTDIRAKKFMHSFEIEAPDDVKICDRKCKLPKEVNSLDEVNGVLCALFREKEDGEYDKE